MKKDRSTVIRYCLSFGIPFVIYMMIGVLLKLYPLSDNTIMCSDLNSQFIHFYNFFKSTFSNNNNLIYSFSKTLGGDMVGFRAYYLNNPFLFLLFLFPYEYMPTGIYVMEVLMLSLASLSFMHYMIRVFGKGNLIFSTCYGMMGYVTAYLMLPIYYTNIILLPLVMIGFDALMKKEAKAKDKIGYALLLALSIVCNYYIGYMLCLFLGLYYIYFCIDKKSLVRIKEFIIYSVLGVLLSCFNLVPVVLSLRDQKDAPMSSILELSRTFRLTGLYRNLLPGFYNFDSSNGSMPYIYVGIVPLICLVYLLISKRVKLSEKIAALFISFVFLISFYLKPLNTVWHAFNEPVGFAHRFAFYFSFVLLSIGYRGYLIIEEDIERYLEKKEKKINLVYISCTILVFTLLELSYNSYHSFKLDVMNAPKVSDYRVFTDRVEPLLDEIKKTEGDEALYRLEKDIMYTMVDPMAFDYAGLSHNSSCEKARVKDFIGKLGFRNQGIWAFYNQGSTSFADSFLGVKYFISRFDSTDKPYESINATDDTYAYKNPYALKLASIMDSDQVKALSEKMDLEGDEYLSKAGSGISNTGNTFSLQNEIASCYGMKEDIFTEAFVSNIRVAGNINISNEMAEHAYSSGVNITCLELEDNESYIEFDVDVKESGKTLYMYFLAPKMQGARIYVNDIDWDDYFSDYRWAVERVGTYNEGDKVTIRILATGEELSLDDYQLYYEDYNVLKDWYEKAEGLGALSVDLKKISSSHIKGSYNATEDSMLVFSIPDDKGWHVKVDGKSVSHDRVLYVLMGINTTAGEHTIELIYVPEGLIAGIIISILALLFCVVIITKESRSTNEI